MIYAIDRFKLGIETEVRADAFYGMYIPSHKSRFFCPECGEPVFWRSKGGSQPNKFCHKPETEFSPPCSLRSKDDSKWYLYERIGLPIFVTQGRGGQFQLNIGFPALGEDLLESLESFHAQVCVCGNSRKCVYVTGATFFENSMTLLPIDFLPSQGKNYKITVTPENQFPALKRKWSDYADGFGSTGAFFTYAETGGKKIRHGDSVFPGQKYYVIAKQFRPPFSEIHSEQLNVIRLNGIEYHVYGVTIYAALKDEQRYGAIGRYLQMEFGIGLLETPPQITALWPPTVTRDVEIPIRETTKIFCAVSSENDIPNTYLYTGNDVKTLTVCRGGQDNIRDVVVPFLETEAVVSVDRKYVGNELIFRKRALPIHNFKYCVVLQSDDGEPLNWNDLTRQDLNASRWVSSNARMDLYLCGANHIFQRVVIRHDTTKLPSFSDRIAVTFIIEGAVIHTFAVRDPKIDLKYNEKQLMVQLRQSLYSRNVPPPAWMRATILEFRSRGYLQAAHFLQNAACSGNVSLHMLSILSAMKQKR